MPVLFVEVPSETRGGMKNGLNVFFDSPSSSVLLPVNPGEAY